MDERGSTSGVATDAMGDQSVASMAATLLGSENSDDAAEAAEAVASVFARVQELARENEELRACVSEERSKQLGLLETQRELEWRLRTGTSSDADAAGGREELADMEARLQLVLTENNVLETRARL